LGLRKTERQEVGSGELGEALPVEGLFEELKGQGAK